LQGHLWIQQAAIERAIANRSLLDAEYRLTTPAGEERWVQIRGRAHYRADGTPLLITGTSQDITDRRAIQSQRALLTRELHQRVQNTLASLQAIVAQTMRRASSVEDASATLTARIQAMAAANTLLITEDFGSVSMEDLIRRSLAPFGVEDTDRFRLSGPNLRLPPQVVVAYALALHELATNASKYGALSNATGVVEVVWSVEGGTAPPLLHMLWREQGGPPVTPPRQTSFGTQLIKRVLATEIGGRVDVDYRAEGVVFTAVAPLAGDDPEALVP
jgi:two-component sensor histidine kinase